MSYETIRVESPGDKVGELVLDRPDKLNTINDTMIEELSNALTEMDSDNDTRCIMLKGAGDRAFSAGADLTSGTGTGDLMSRINGNRGDKDIFGKMMEIHTPVIAAIDGYCLGGGFEISCCVDLRIASSDSEIGLPEHKRGLLPGWGGTARLPRLIGESLAKEIIFTARHYDPEPLQDYGFIHEVYPSDEFDEKAHSYAAEIAGGPPIAQGQTKKAIHHGRENYDLALELETFASAHLMNTEDLQEGISAFVEKREPEFKGK